MSRNADDASSFDISISEDLFDTLHATAKQSRTERWRDGMEHLRSMGRKIEDLMEVAKWHTDPETNRHLLELLKDLQTDLAVLLRAAGIKRTHPRARPALIRKPERALRKQQTREKHLGRLSKTEMKALVRERMKRKP